jgi:seryl-tRNA synthetase
MSVEKWLHGDESGFVGLAGPLHTLSEALDGAFLDLAFSFGAELQEFGPLLPVRDLRKIDYFSAFPHLVTFPASLPNDSEELHEFARANGAEADGPLHLNRLASVSSVLAPAACYAVYIAMEGASLSSEPRRITVKGTCFRSESSFVPLVRQRCFRMREIVHLGDRESVEQFLLEGRERVLRLADAWGLATSIEAATDPFFDPARSPKYLHARLFPSKHELIAGNVAIASFNNHRNFFGEAFCISANGTASHTACIAFGIERWVNAILCTHGNNPADWPLLNGVSARQPA